MQASTIENWKSATQPDRNIRVLKVATGATTEGSSIVLYLHGKSSSGTSINELPLVCRNLAIPFQALMGCLEDTVVLAPQVPETIDSYWDWEPYLDVLADNLLTAYGEKRIKAIGFSRGGLGVVKLVRRFPELASHYAAIDPASPSHHQIDVLATTPSRTSTVGWLRYTDDLKENIPFSRRLAEGLDPEDSRFVSGYSHSAIALSAFNGERLEGRTSLYEFMEIPYSTHLRKAQSSE